MVNTIIDLIYEVKQVFEKIIDNTLDDWTEKYNENIISDDIESWYHQDDENLVAEIKLSILSDDTHEYEDFNICVILDSASHVEVDITKYSYLTVMDFPLDVDDMFDEEWFRQKLEYRFARAFTL